MIGNPFWKLKAFMIFLFYVGADGFSKPPIYPGRTTLKHALSISSRSNVRPLNDNVLIQMFNTRKTSSSGLFIPRSSDDYNRGKVVDVGPGITELVSGIHLKPPVSAGDNVIYENHIGESIKIDGVDHCVVNQKSILLTYSDDGDDLSSIKCLQGQLLVRISSIAKPQERKQGELITSHSKNVVPSVGEVVKVGEGLVGPGNVKVGEQVKFRHHSTTKGFSLDGESYLLIRNEDVLAVWSGLQ